MSKRLSLCRKLCRNRHGVSLIDKMKTRWGFFLRSATAKRFAIFAIIGLAILLSAVILQGISLHKLKTLNEIRISLTETRAALAEIDNRWAQMMNDRAEVMTIFLETREQVDNLEGTEQEINEAKSRLREIEIELEEFEANTAAVWAQRMAVESSVLVCEGEITILEQDADCDWRIFGLLLSIGMLFFTYGLWVYNLSRERA